MLTEVDMERILAAKRCLFEQAAKPSDDSIDEYELLDDAEYPHSITETNGLM